MKTITTKIQNIFTAVNQAIAAGQDWDVDMKDQGINYRNFRAIKR